MLLQSVIGLSTAGLTTHWPRRDDAARGAFDEVGTWAALALDEVEYGVLLLRADGRVFWTNHRAQAALRTGHPLALERGQLVASRACDATLLALALSAAGQRGLRKLLALGEGAQRVGVALVPLQSDEPAGVVMVTIGKPRMCDALTVESFARSVGLTAAEARVLNDLCEGSAPGSIARRHGVAMSTVRTQISSIRGKTGSVSIDALLHQMARLPPLLSTLRASFRPGSAYDHDEHAVSAMAESADA